MASPDELSHVRTVWARMKPSSPIYAFLLSDISLTSASKGSVSAHLAVQAVHVNSKGTLHGTVSACLVDWAGGMAIASTGLDKTGASTDLHITYVQTVKEGDALEIEAKASRAGSTLAYTTVELRRASDGAIVCLGVHTKYVKQ